MKQFILAAILTINFNVVWAQSVIGLNNSGSLATTGFVHAVGEIYVVPVNPDSAASGTVGTVSQILFGTLGVEDFIIANGVKYYPNPVENHLTIELNEAVNLSKAEIYDSKGIKVDFKIINSNIINMSALSSGIYFMHFPGTKTKSIKIIKK